MLGLSLNKGKTYEIQLEQSCNLRWKTNHSFKKQKMCFIRTLSNSFMIIHKYGNTVDSKNAFILLLFHFGFQVRGKGGTRGKIVMSHDIVQGDGEGWSQGRE